MYLQWFLVVLFSLVIGITVCQAGDGGDNEMEIAENYLKQFGYYDVHPSGRKVNHGDPGKAPSKEQRLAEATRKFQKFVGLPVTGKIDANTKKAMDRPRCGVPDVRVMAKDATPYHWTKRNLTWRLDSYPSEISEQNTRKAIQEAFEVWRKVIPLDFREVPPNTRNADLKILFARYTHGDPWPFDGRGRVLAHAMFPPDGRAHFDEDEHWAYRDTKILLDSWRYTDLLAVAIHELGHALGLSHSRHRDSIMAPFYKAADFTNGYQAPSLHSDDIYHIQKLYGRRGITVPTTTIITPTESTTSSASSTVATTSTTTTTTKTETQGFDKGNRNLPTPKIPADGPASDSCPTQITGATKTMNGKSYVFSMKSVWEFDEDRHRIGKMEEVQSLFPRGPRTVFAAVTNPRTQLTLLFERRRVWAYIWDQKEAKFKLHPSFPKILSKDIHFQPRGAFIWRDGNVVLINKNNFVTYDSHWNVPTMVGSTNNYFPQFPASVTAAIKTKTDKLLLFSDSKAYLYKMSQKKLLNEKGLDLEMLFMC